MRKFLILSVLCCISYLADAQIIVRSQKDKNVTTVSSTVITKTKTKRVHTKYDAKIGYQQFVELGVTSIDGYKGGTGINYIGGWRFNNWLYAGVGTGLKFSHIVDTGLKEHVGESIEFIIPHNNSWTFASPNIEEYQYEIREYFKLKDIGGSLNAVSIPLYLNVRTFLTKTKWSPYAAISLGGDLALKECGVYFDLSTGVNYRLNEQYNFYTSLGFFFKGGRQNNLSDFSYYDYTYENAYFDHYAECEDKTCPYSGKEYYGHTHIIFDNLWHVKSLYYGMSFRIGVSF